MQDLNPETRFVAITSQGCSHELCCLPHVPVGPRTSGCGGLEEEAQAF